MRLLLVDNYDSFTFNLVQALGALGAAVEVVRNDAVSVDEALGRSVDAFVISPGPCTPATSGISVDLVRRAASDRRPLLGVCLGHQAIGEALGGRVVSAARLRHGKTSEVHHEGSGLFEGLPTPFQAMRYHSLVVEEPLPDELVRTAWTEPPDGTSPELMGLRHRELPIHGVQFHPESYLSPHGVALLGNFLRLASSRA